MADPPVTRRWPEPVTLRWPDPEADPAAHAGRPTLRHTAEPAAPGIQPPGTWIAERFRVLGPPLGGITGEAEVYRCRDEHLGEEVAVKLYRYDATPKDAVIAQLEGLAHPHVLRLIDHGRWRGRFFEVSELCRGGVMADAMPYTESDLRALLPAMLQGLDFCHRQGIVHRDLKPNNLFFRDAARTQVLIGDFGISSYLEREAGAVRHTLTAASLTLDYAAPELLDGHEVGPKTDYYALGITLLHLLLGHSPFHGRSPNDVLVAHLRGRLPLPDGLSPEFRQLVGGLTLGNPQVRWGLPQVSAWLRGEPVALDLAHAAWAVAVRDGQPYPGWPEARTPAQLAAALARFDAHKQLLRGDIRRWVFDHFDQTLAERIAQLEQEPGTRPEVLLGRLRHLLDPAAPLAVGQHPVHDLTGLLELLTQPRDRAVSRELGRLLRDGLLEAWIAAARAAGERSDELLARIAALRRRLPGVAHQAVALDALLFTLAPHTPLRLTADCAVSSPRELALAFEREPAALGTALKRELFSRRLDEWLRAAAFPGWQDHLTLLDDLRRRHLDQPLLAVYTLCWRFNPEMPLRFGNLRVARPHRLARLIDRSAADTARGIEMLEQGWLRAWLVGAGKVRDAAALDQALLALDLSPAAKLEAVLHLLDPALPPPRLEVRPRHLLFGRMVEGDSRVRVLHLSNAGRGHLSGEIGLERYGAGLVLDTYRIEGNSLDLQVRVVSLGLARGNYTNTLVLRSNGGQREIPVRFGVKDPPDTRGWWDRLLDRWGP